MRKAVVAVLSAVFIGSGLFAAASYTAPVTGGVEASAIPYSPNINYKQNRHISPRPGHRIGGGGGSW